MTATAHTAAEIITVFGEAIRDGRIDDVQSLYEPDAVFIPQPGAQPVSGSAAIRAALAPFAQLKPTMTGDILKVVHAGDIATVLNRWQLHATAPDGTPVRMGGTSADVMRRRPDGTWGILIDDPWGAATTDQHQ